MKNLLALICIVLSLGTAKAQLYTMNVYVHDSVETGPWVSYCQSTIENVTFYTTPQSPLLTTLNIFRTGGDVTIIQVSLIDSITYTPGCAVSCPETITDIDGYTYDIVQIGNQCWMEENLRTTRYNDGSVIPNVTDDAAWIGLTTPAWCNFDNNPSNDGPKGKLYNWYTVAASNMCPTGWHVPSDAEWIALINHLDANVPPTINPNIAGGKMKSVTGWYLPNFEATNESGFTAFPSGYRDSDIGNFIGPLEIATYWSSTESEYENDKGFSFGLNWSNGFCYRSSYVKRLGYSVRCIKD